MIGWFLITSILLQERNDFGAFSLKDFYIRRCLRIWPAYYFCLAVVALTGYASLTCVGITAVYLTNYEIAFDWNLPRNLPHLWSLAVEEQFYLV